MWVLREKSALAQLHKRAFYWENQSGSPELGPLPRKHSLEGVSPYPCALAERSQYYHCTALTLSPPQPPPTPLLFLLLSSLLCSPRSSFLLLVLLLLLVPRCSLHAPQLNRLQSGGCDLRRNVISSPAVGCAPPQISCDSFPLHCLPAWRRRPPHSNYIQICSIWSDHKSMRGFFKLVRCAVYNVHCYSTEDWFENEDQLEKVIMDVEMFMTRNKQGLALKYRKSPPFKFHLWLKWHFLLHTYWGWSHE